MTGESPGLPYRAPLGLPPGKDYVSTLNGRVHYLMMQLPKLPEDRLWRCARVTGSCMEPLISDDDVAVFWLVDDTNAARRGDVVVVDTGHGLQVKMLVEDDGVRWLSPLDGQDEYLLTPSMRIVGVVDYVHTTTGMRTFASALRRTFEAAAAAAGVSGR
jgi:phage repressor protein C with HTH and peptisase S24 domain